MFKKLFGGNDKPARTLTRVGELQVGDIITLKHRNELPPSLQGKDLEVSSVATYQYSSYNSTEFTLRGDDGAVVFVSEDDDDGEISLCFSRKIPRDDVLTLFDEDAFAMLWDEEEFPEFDSRPFPELEGWYAEAYRQSVKCGQGFYYNRDCRNETLSRYSGTDNGEEFQFQECEGNDDAFGLSVEVWEDGSTDVFLQVYTNTDVVENYYPHGE